MPGHPRVNFYCSLISAENYSAADDYYSFGPTYSHIKPETVEWVYGGGCMPAALEPLTQLPEEGIEVSLFTDKDIISPLVDATKTRYKVALLNECRSIHPFAYSWIIDREDKFDCIFTYDADLLQRSKKYVKYKPVMAGSWIKEEEHQIYEKSKLGSIVVTEKGKDMIISPLARGHKLRHIVADLIKRREYDIDLWGRAYKYFEKKTEPLEDYYFNISIINASHANYFNDNLTDCFRTGTLPIAWGCPNIGEYFNEKGILQFQTGPELVEILESLSPVLYEERFEYVKDNFDRVRAYNRVDDNLFALMQKTLNLNEL